MDIKLSWPELKKNVTFLTTYLLGVVLFPFLFIYGFFLLHSPVAIWGFFFFIFTGLIFYYEFGLRGIILTCGLITVAWLSFNVMNLITSPFQSLSTESTLIISSLSAFFIMAFLNIFRRLNHYHKNITEQYQIELERILSQKNQKEKELQVFKHKHKERKRQKYFWNQIASLCETVAEIREVKKLQKTVKRFINRLYPQENTNLYLSAEIPLPGNNVFSRDNADGEYTGLEKYVTDLGAPCLVENKRSNTRFQKNSELDFEGLSAIATPIISAEQAIGVLSITSSENSRFTAAGMNELSHLANLFRTALINVALYQKIRDMALTDSLTGLPKRSYFETRYSEECERATRADQKLTVAMMDIDHFKEINDQYGHPFGDEVLKRISEIIIQKVEKSGFPARYGGEEFVVIFPQTKLSTAKTKIEEIRMETELQSFVHQRNTIQVTLSGGLATYPEDVRNVEQLIEKADDRLYQAKENGRNQVCANGE